MARTFTNIGLWSLGRGRSELGPGSRRLLNLLHQSIFRTLTPSSSCTSPLTHCPRLPPLTCPLPLGQVRGGGATSTLGLGRGKGSKRGTEVWLELPQLLTLGRKGRGCRPNEKQENICVTLASSGGGGGEGPGGRRTGWSWDPEDLKACPPPSRLLLFPTSAP